MNEIYTVAEAATKARVSRPTIYRLLKTGQGPVVRKIANRSVILAEDLDAWLKALPAREA